MSSDNEKRSRFNRACSRIPSGVCAYCGFRTAAARQVMVEVPLEELDEVSRLMLDSDKGREFRHGPARNWIVCQPCDSALRSRPQLSEALALASAFLGMPADRKLQRTVEDRYRYAAPHPWTPYAKVAGARPEKALPRPWAHLQVDEIRAACEQLDGPVPCPSGGCASCGVSTVPVGEQWHRLINGHHECASCSRAGWSSMRSDAFTLALAEHLDSDVETIGKLIRASGARPWSKTNEPPAETRFSYLDEQRMRSWLKDFETELLNAQKLPSW